MNNDDTVNQGPSTDQFPDLAVPSELQTDDGPVDTSEGTTQKVRWDFCLLFAGRAWVTLPVFAPSPDDAASTMAAFVQQVNVTLANMGYPPNICTWATGPCS